MRGDRPSPSARASSVSLAAPHARGSTRESERRSCARSGCPACAGIDPRMETALRATHGLPRMRGDRPDEQAAAPRAAVAAPHARGSTPVVRALTNQRTGCPACAGIDPRERRLIRRDSRLPRMRGDRPSGDQTQVVACGAAPHARGSTQRPPDGLKAAPGCPACAGIDPLATLRAARGLWLPRMRGDRPGATEASASETAAAPHARGSTQFRRVAETGRRGCPACAGIDRTRCDRHSRAPWLPRMRGDRPAIDALIWRLAEAAPHARGSTLESPGFARAK